mmetsp:Transcript_62734/g.167556  ORF Transcript_62734/g.167556 Transcript_62734/m.167556 type:complete len:299 (-) Transcript_62734:1313-2209(-)
MQAERLGVVDASSLCAAVLVVHEGLDAVAQGVSVLEEQRAVLLEGVRVGEEHRLGADDLLVDDGQELRDAAAGLPGQAAVELSPKLLQEAAPLLLSALAVGGRRGTAVPLPADRAARRLDLRLQRERLPQEEDELLEARRRPHDAREVAGKLAGAQDVVEVDLPLRRARPAEHAHRLCGLAHRSVDAARREGQEDLADAEDEPGQVERAQDVLGQDPTVHNEAESLLRRCGGVVVVHERGRHLHKVRASQGCDHAHRITVDAAPDGQDHHAKAIALRASDRRQQLGLAECVWALVGLA